MSTLLVRRVLLTAFAVVAFVLAGQEYRAKGMTRDSAITGGAGVALAVLAITAKG